MKQAFGILIFSTFLSCNNNPNSTPQTITDSTSKTSAISLYPSQDFNEVALYYLDSAYYDNENLIEMETSVMTARYTNGLAFIDSLGKPVTNFFKKRNLTNEEISELKSIFTLDETSTETTSCLPFYRDVFVFYHNKEQVAQAQICFECSQLFLTPNSSLYFEKRNWADLQGFIKTLKAT